MSEIQKQELTSMNYNTSNISDRIIRESRYNQSTEFYGGYCKPWSENDISK